MGKAIVFTLGLFHIRMKDAAYLLGKGRVGIIYPLQIEFHQLLNDIETGNFYFNHALMAVNLLNGESTHFLVLLGVRGLFHQALTEAAPT